MLFDNVSNRGIRKMKESLPPQALREKLPRFLQKCAQTFETDRRYSNDLRYLRVWLQLVNHFVKNENIHLLSDSTTDHLVLIAKWKLLGLDFV